MNKLYYKYDDYDRGEYFFRVADSEDERFIPKKNEPIIIMYYDRIISSTICIGDGRRSVQNLPKIEGVMDGNLFIVKPTVMSNWKMLEILVKGVEEFIAGEVGKYEFWEFMKYVSDYTDCPVTDKEETMESIYTMLRTFVFYSWRIINTAKESTDWTADLGDLVDPDEKKFGDRIREFRLTENTINYLPKFEEVLVCRGEEDGPYLYIGDGEHTIGELNPYRDLYFFDNRSTIQELSIVKLDHLFDFGLKQTINLLNRSIGTKPLEHVDTLWLFRAYNKELQQYTDVNIKDIFGRSFDEFRKFVIQIKEIVDFAYRTTGWARVIRSKGGYEY